MNWRSSGCGEPPSRFAAPGRDAVVSGGGSEGRRMKAASLGENAVAVVGFLNLDKDERQPVDKECDVWAELLIAIFAGELGDDMKGISINVLEVDDLQT